MEKTSNKLVDLSVAFAIEILNLVKRNGISYFRCCIPLILTNGSAREVKISLKNGNLTSRLFDVILKFKVIILSQP